MVNKIVVENAGNFIEVETTSAAEINTSIESVEINLEVVSEGPVGPPGLEGKRGSQGKGLEYEWQGAKLGIRIEGEAEFQYQELIGKDTFVWDQSQAESVWEIPHTMNKYPVVSVVDSAGSLVHGDVEYISESMVKVTFSSRFSGKAYLN